jgi:hypothetical protein
MGRVYVKRERESATRRPWIWQQVNGTHTQVLAFSRQDSTAGQQQQQQLWSKEAESVPLFYFPLPDG